MQKVKVVQIGPRSFTIKELPVRAVWELMNNEQGESEQLPFGEKLNRLLSMACPELSKDTIIDLYPSEIEELWQAFQEVNSAFLGVVRQIGLFEILVGGIKPILERELTNAMVRAGQTLTEPSVLLSNPATAQ